MTAVLDEHHAQYPLRAGMLREELKSRVQGRNKWPAKLFNELIARGVADNLLAEVNGELVCRPGFTPTFKPEQQDARRRTPGSLPAPALYAALDGREPGANR